MAVPGRMCMCVAKSVCTKEESHWFGGTATQPGMMYENQGTALKGIKELAKEVLSWTIC